MGMHLNNLAARGRATRTDGPDGFIGDCCPCTVGLVGDAAAQLPRHDIQRPARVALGLGLAYADDGREPRPPRRTRFRSHVAIGLMMEMAALGMSDDDV